MNTFGRKRNSARCSKLGVALMFWLMATAPQYGMANVAKAEQHPDVLVQQLANPSATENVYYFVASLTDGTQLSIPFSERPVLTCQGVDLKLTTTKMEMDLPHGSVKEFTLDRKEIVSGVKEIGAEAQMDRVGNDFYFSNCREGVVVAVFDRGGRQITSKRVGANGECQISLQGQPDGLYIMKSESITCKILKK